MRLLASRHLLRGDTPLIHGRKGGDAMTDFEIIMIVLTVFLIVLAAHNKK